MVRKINIKNMDEYLCCSCNNKQAVKFLKENDKKKYLELLEHYTGIAIGMDACRKCGTENEMPPCADCNNNALTLFFQEESDPCVLSDIDTTEDVLGIVGEQAGWAMLDAARVYWLNTIGLSDFIRILANSDLCEQYRLISMLYPSIYDANKADIKQLESDWMTRNNPSKYADIRPL